MAEELSLKWGTLKSWKLESEKTRAIMQQYINIGASTSAMMQRDTPEQKLLICDLIDTVDCKTIYLDWDGKDVSKEEAKKYVMDYPR